MVPGRPGVDPGDPDPLFEVGFARGLLGAWLEPGAASASDGGVGMLLAAHREIHCNLTGGTTAMQVNVEWVAGHAAAGGHTVVRLACIDRRDPATQQRELWVVGELNEISRVGPEER